MGSQRVGHNWATELNWTELTSLCDLVPTLVRGVMRASPCIQRDLHLIWQRKSLILLFSSVQLLSHFQLLAAPWTAAHQVSLSVTNTQSLLKLMSIESVMPSNHLILSRPLLLLPWIFPSIGVFSNELGLQSGGQSIGASASASVLPVNIQDWFPLGLTGLISLQAKGLSRIFCSTAIQKHKFFGT